MARGTGGVSAGSDSATPRVWLFGGLRVEVDGRLLDLGPPKQRAVLAMLALEARRVVSTDRFIGLLFDDDEGAITSLQAYVSRLRRILEPGRDARDATVLVTRRPGYVLDVASDDIDVERFDLEIRAARALIDEGEARAGADQLRAAIELAGTPLLPEFADLPFVVDAARRIEAARIGAIDTAASAYLGAGDATTAVSLLEQVVRDHPDRERSAWLLARAYYADRRQADALDVVARCRRALRERTGLEPGPDLERLERDILDHAPHLTTVAATPPAPTTSSPPATPGRVRELVGRDRELDGVTQVLDSASTGVGGAIVVSGEPGIGKTAFASAAVEFARARGWTVSWVRCAERRESAPRWLGLDRTATSEEPSDDDRARRFDAIVQQVSGDGEPVLVVVDDLQWADADTLRLIQYVTVDLATLPLVVIATCRPVPGDADPALVDALVELGRVPNAHQFVLDPLSADDIEQWLGRLDTPIAEGVPTIVHERTGGNPLFVHEVTELLAANGGLADAATAANARTIPPAVQLVVRRRVSQLDATTQRLLSIAAVLGSATPTVVIADAAGCSALDALAALAPAFEAGLLVGSTDEPQFSHALVADALAGEVNDARRAVMHAAAARSLAERAGDSFGVDAARIAHHAVAGILDGTADLAIDAGRAAAEQASAWSGHEDAAAHWALVADVARRARPADVETRVDALIEQARCLVRVDMERQAKGPILEAIRAAHTIGDVDRMARAAGLLNTANVWSIERYGDVNHDVIAALERTIELLPADDPRAALLLGALPGELVFADADRHASACERSVEAARRTGDPHLLALALNGTILPKRPGDLERRRAAADEMLAILATHRLPVELEYAAHHHAGEVCLEVGDLDAAARHVDAGKAALAPTGGTRLRSQHLWFAATLANATGRYEEAANLGDGAFALHRRRRQYGADVLMLSGKVALTVDRGGFEQLLGAVVNRLDLGGYQRSTAEILAFGALEAGLPERAVALVDLVPPDTGFPDDYMRLCSATAALHVRVELGRRGEADAIAAVLDGFEDRWAGGGTSPVSCGFGSLALARLAAADGDHDAAARWFDRAFDSARRAGAVAWLARTHVWHGEFLHGIGDTDAAGVAYEQARAIATRHRLLYVHRRLGELAP
ncbi:MAG: BTAD domain-containing putative transcriptional regulator [Ilumatobacteraceae bacterium]